MRNLALKIFLGLFVATGSLCSAHFDGQRINRPELTEKQKNKALIKLDAHKAKLANAKASATLEQLPHPDAAFQGWWKMETRGNQSAYGFGEATDDIDTYVYIDISEFDPYENPIIQLHSLCGTPTMPRECTPLDTPDGIFLNLFYVPDSTSLVNILDLNGPLFDPEFGQSWWSLKLQADKQTIVTTTESRPEWEGYGATSGLLRKIDSPPPVRPYDDTGTSFPRASDPVAMAKYIYNALKLNHNQPQNINFNDEDYRSYEERKSIFNKMLDKGISYETKIRKIRVSRPGLHDALEFGGSYTTTDALTDIFTDGFSYATAGSTVEIKGFKGKWAKLNGTYVNGVSIIEDGAVPNPSNNHVDVSSSNKPKKGTFRNVFNHFMLDCDTSNCKDFPRDELGWAKDIEGDPVVKVCHRFSSDMEYPAFYAAVRAMFYALYQVSQHNAQVAYFKPGSAFLIDTWEELKEAAATDNFWNSDLYPGDNLLRTRTHQKAPSGFYNNPCLAERGVTTYNDPFGLNQMPGGKYDYNIVLANYIVSPKNLYWAIAGTPTGVTQFDPEGIEIGDFVYKPTIPGTQPAEFVGMLGDIEVVNGKPQPLNPDQTHYSLFGSIDTPTDDLFNSNGYYIGLIDPSLTHGKRVGYLRWIDEIPLDPGFYMATSTFPPGVPVTAKYGREAYCQVISKFTHYFQTEQDCDAVILDVRTNNGGYDLTEFNLAEFFGDDRAAHKTLWSKKDNGDSALINLSNPSDYQSFNNTIARDEESFAQFYVRQNEKNYGPGVVFKGSPNRPKKVIVLTDTAAASGGDIFPHFFMGENLDGNLGSFTTCKIIGDIDGRLKGASTFRSPLPVSEFNNDFYGSDGLPFSPIRYRADYAWGQWDDGLTGQFYNQQSDDVAPSHAPSLKGTAGRAPLPNDWENTVWQDIGLIKVKDGHFSHHIKKKKPVKDDRSTWRDSWLEQAILEAIE